MEAEPTQPDAQAPDPLQQFYRAHNQHVFSVQLEFICSLANPSYIVFLSQKGHLQDKRFLRYLKHLQATWKQPQYARFVRYPYGLYFLEALQRPEFRVAVAVDGWEARAKSQIISHWATWCVLSVPVGSNSLADDSYIFPWAGASRRTIPVFHFDQPHCALHIQLLSTFVQSPLHCIVNSVVKLVAKRR